MSALISTAQLILVILGLGIGALLCLSGFVLWAISGEQALRGTTVARNGCVAGAAGLILFAASVVFLKSWMLA